VSTGQKIFPSPEIDLPLVPAVLIGIILGPIAAKFLDATQFGAAVKGQQDAITLVGFSGL